jgi:CRP-like cAMP-binding protein
MKKRDVPAAAVDCDNFLLANLPDDEYQQLRPHLELFPTPQKTVIYEKDKEIKYVHFPVSGAHSVLAYMKSGAAVEVGTIGKEGLSTVDVLTGATMATETTICQIGGYSLRVALDKFNEIRAKAPELERLSYRFFKAYLCQVSQSVACNRLHSTVERFARWMLISHDRVDGDTFELTQEFLADMLGVHRPSVSVIAKEFQDRGLITYHRGVISILDREGLEKTSCECYDVVKSQFQRAIGKAVG